MRQREALTHNIYRRTIFQKFSVGDLTTRVVVVVGSQRVAVRGGRFRRRRGAVAVVAALVLLLAACSSSSSSSSSKGAGAPRHGGTLTVGLEAQGNSLLPGVAAFDSSGYNIARAIFDPLMRQAGDGSYQPWLAKSLTPNATLSQWTLTLRPNVVFSDGTPLTAQAVSDVLTKYTMTPTSNLAGVLSVVKSFQVTGPLTGVYDLTQPDAGFPDLMSGPAGWIFSAAAADAAGSNAGNQPVGTGPFMLSQVVPNSETVAVRNPHYWITGQPYLDKIVFRPIPDENARYAGLASGDLNVIQTFRGTTMTQIRSLANGGKYQYLPYSGNRNSSAIFNVRVAPVDDVNVRRAIAMSVDQTKSAAVLGFKGLAKPVSQYFSPSSPWYVPSAAGNYPSPNITEAKKLVQAYVNSPTRSDGKKPGSPLTIDFQCIGGSTVAAAVQLFQADLQSIGIDFKLNTVDQATLLSNVLGAASQKPGYSGTYMMSCWANGSDYAGTRDPYNVFAAEYGSPTTDASNYTNFTTPALTAAIQDLGTHTDVATRKADVAKIAAILGQEVPVLWSAGSPNAIGGQAKVGGLANWVFPDGTKGNGHPDAEVTWGQVWLGS